MVIKNLRVQMYKVMISLILFCTYTFGYELEDRLTAIIVGKVEKFVL